MFASVASGRSTAMRVLTASPGEDVEGAEVAAVGDADDPPLNQIGRDRYLRTDSNRRQALCRHLDIYVERVQHPEREQGGGRLDLFADTGMARHQQ